MDEQLTGPTSGEARAPDESERLIREEFGGPHPSTTKPSRSRTWQLPYGPVTRR